MENPTFAHPIKDSTRGVKFIVMAYRELSLQEVVQCVHTYLINCKKKNRPKKGHTVTIYTVIGAGGW